MLGKKQIQGALWGRMMVGIGAVLGGLGIGAPGVYAQEAPGDETFHVTPSALQTVEGLFRSWCQAINTAKGNPTALLAMYAPNAMVLPPMPTKLLLKEENGIAQYYTTLTKLPDIQCEVNQITPKIYNKSWAVNTGAYTIRYSGSNHDEEVRSNFTVVYQKVGDKWLIINQTLSVLPDIQNEP